MSEEECFAPLSPQCGGCHKWPVERLAVRVIPVPGCFGQIDMKNRFELPGVFDAEMIRRAVSCKSNTGTGVFGQIDMKNRFPTL